MAALMAGRERRISAGHDPETDGTGRGAPSEARRLPLSASFACTPRWSGRNRPYGARDDYLRASRRCLTEPLRSSQPDDCGRVVWGKRSIRDEPLSEPLSDLVGRLRVAVEVPS